MQIVVYTSFLYMPVVCITLHVMCRMLDVQRSDWCRRQWNVSPAVSDCTQQSHCTVPWESFCAGGCRRPVEVRCSLILLLHAALVCKCGMCCLSLSHLYALTEWLNTMSDFLPSGSTTFVVLWHEGLGKIPTGSPSPPWGAQIKGVKDLWFSTNV